MGESGDAGRVGERCLQGKWRLQGDERPYMYMYYLLVHADETTRRRDHGETRPQGDETGNDTKGDQLRESLESCIYATGTYIIGTFPAEIGIREI